jgi:predicted RNA binding protein YcfA (HicA-like mRNA interferase family)
MNFKRRGVTLRQAIKRASAVGFNIKRRGSEYIFTHPDTLHPRYTVSCKARDVHPWLMSGIIRVEKLRASQ